ncbi:MAG TPA: hypothetical protein P5210_16475, partial [Draconibacterium sp.]|nr:hypothetical protein [Draconibacterium sp.]
LREIGKTIKSGLLSLKTMKEIILAAVAFLVVFGVHAQTNVDEIDFIQSVYGMQKRDLISKHMKLEPDQSDLFWNLYNEYEISRREIGLKRMKNIENYADKYDSLSDLDADALIKTTFEVNLEFLKLWEKTYKVMSKSISSVTAAQFIQAEMFFENIIRQQLAMEIPMIGEFEIKE